MYSYENKYVNTIKELPLKEAFLHLFSVFQNVPQILYPNIPWYESIQAVLQKKKF